MSKLILGDCLLELPKLEVDSVDLIVTDPPYGYSFMGKDWDKAVPSVDIWKQCLRVLKPGAFAFVMSSPRADVLSHMIVNLSDAGFRTDFTPIYWAYASGFPKAMNISKTVDKRLGVEREVIGLSDALKGRASANKGGYGQHIGNESINAFPDGYPITKPKSEEAKKLDGSYGGFQPKPAVEVIIVAMKPLSEKTFVDQALRNGKGLTWLDDSRIPFQSEDEKEKTERGLVTRTFDRNEIISVEEAKRRGINSFETHVSSDGRFPANLLVSDDCLNDGTQWEGKDGFKKTACSIYGNELSAYSYNGDSKASYGSFSRYFSLDAWFEKQFKKLPLKVQRTFPFLLEPKASKSERNTNLDNLNREQPAFNYGSIKKSVGQTGVNTPRANNHPTVKPLQLMSYLITLGSRTNDLILDPFVGSGTTCLAAKMLGRNFLGIELNKDYYDIAIARVENHKTLFEFALNRNSSTQNPNK